MTTNKIVFSKQDRDNIVQVLERQKTIERVLSNKFAEAPKESQRNDQLGPEGVRSSTELRVDQPIYRMVVTDTKTGQVLHDMQARAVFGVVMGYVPNDPANDETMAVVAIGEKPCMVKTLVQARDSREKVLNTLMGL